MKNTANSNITGYECAQAQTWDLFADRLDGDAQGHALVMSTHYLDDRARHACESSLAALGYGQRACAFATLAPDEGAPALDGGTLAALVEGLDPLCMVVADAQAARLLGKAYGQLVALDAPNRVLGRDVAAFDDLEALMDSPELKQKAWALFKTLPRFGELNRRKL